MISFFTMNLAVVVVSIILTRIMIRNRIVLKVMPRKACEVSGTSGASKVYG